MSEKITPPKSRNLSHQSYRTNDTIPDTLSMGDIKYFITLMKRLGYEFEIEFEIMDGGLLSAFLQFWSEKGERSLSVGAESFGLNVDTDYSVIFDKNGLITSFNSGYEEFIKEDGLESIMHKLTKKEENINKAVKILNAVSDEWTEGWY